MSHLRPRLTVLLVLASIPAAMAIMAITGVASAADPGNNGHTAYSALPRGGCVPQWNVVTSPNPGSFARLYATTALSPGDVWAVGTYNDPTTNHHSTLTEHWDGSQWSQVPSPNPTGDVDEVILLSVSGSASNDVWAAGYYSNYYANTSALLLHWDGTQWSIVPSMDGYDYAFFGVVSLSTTDAWAVGSYYNVGTPLIMHWNGTQWSQVASPHPGSRSHLSSIDALSANDIWAVGSTVPTANAPARTMIVHWNGTQWSLVPSADPPTAGDNSLTGISVVSANDVWAVGSVQQTYSSPWETLTEHWDGTQWSIVPSPNPGVGPNGSQLQAVAATASNDVWAVGSSDNQTLIMHWDGTQWGLANSPSSGILYGVAATAGNDAWAVGDYNFPYNDLIERYTGQCSSATPTSVATSTRQATSTASPTNTSEPASSATATRTTQPTPGTPAPTATSCSIEYPDVPPGSTFYDYVHCLACRGIISGYPNGTFGPSNPVTRGQLSKIVSNAAGYIGDFATNTFEDVAVGSTFFPYVERLFAHDAIGGYPCGGEGEPCVPPANKPYFRPNANVTRGQTSKIVATAKALPNPIPGQASFEDVPSGSTFWRWIEPLAATGAIGGYPCGGEGEPCVPPANKPYFRPGANVTRGQSAKIVTNTFFPSCVTPSR